MKKMNKKILSDAYNEIDDLADKLGENFYDAIMEEDNSTYEMGKGILNAFGLCETDRDFEIADAMLMGSCGYCFQTLIERIEELDEDEDHEWMFE